MRIMPPGVQKMSLVEKSHLIDSVVSCYDASSYTAIHDLSLKTVRNSSRYVDK